MEQMAPAPDRLVSALFLAFCLASFAWGMRAFFVQPRGFTRGMKVITVVSAVFAVLHLGAILLAGDVLTVFNLTAIAMYCIALILYWWAISVNRRTPLAAAFSFNSPRHLMQE